MKQKILSDVLRLLVVFLALSVCGCEDDKTQRASNERDDAESKEEVRIGSPANEAGGTIVAAELKEAYQIRNKKYDLLLRPRNADSADGVPIVLYYEQPWKCLSWQMNKQGEDSYKLVNFFTSRLIHLCDGVF